MLHREISTDACIDVWGMVRIAASAINKKRGCSISALLLADLMSDAANFTAIDEGQFYWLIREHGTNIIENIDEWYEVINDCPEWMVFDITINKAKSTCIIGELVIE